MITPVIMPKLGLTMEKGSVAEWHAKEGERIVKGEPLFVATTDKADMEIEAPASGILRKILVDMDVDVPVTEHIAIIADEDDDISEYLKGAEPAKVEQTKEVAEPPQTTVQEEKAPAKSPGGRIIASPAAKRVAKERGIDLSLIEGTGPGGRITTEDVERFSPEEAVKIKEELVPLTRIEGVAAERLTEASRDIPHINLFMDVNCESIVQIRVDLSQRGISASYNDIIVKALASTLREFPRVNSILEGVNIRLLPDINIGIATATDQGLMVPVLKNAGRLDIAGIAQETAKLTESARSGTLSLDDISGGTFTITNLGMYGVSRFTAIINPPQVAILSVGAIVKRVVVVDDNTFKIQPAMTLNLVCDHRVIDGALGAKCLKKLKETLETVDSVQ